MAKAPACDAIMPPGKMKPLLALSKHEPVHAAIGLTTDGEGLILLHKKAKPKKVLSMLRAEAGKAKLQLAAATLRFGRAEVDTDYDSGMVRFFINKDAPGNMRVKLLEVVKRVPYQKVEINVDPSLEAEPEEDEEGSEDQAEGEAHAESPEAALAALRTELASLIPQINAAVGSDAELGRTMKMDAQEANEGIKKGDVAGATTALARLKEHLGTASSSGTQASPARTAEAKPAPAINFVAMQKSRLIWDAARKKVAGEIDAFKTTVSKQFEGDPEEIAMIDALDELDEILYTLDDRLLDTLDAGLNEADPEKHAALVADAKGLIDEYLAYVQSDPMIKALGADNPLGARLSVGSVVTGTLKALQATLH